MIQKMNLAELANNIPELNQYLKVGQLNDHQLNIIRTETRVLDFHKHDKSDELFFVVEGRMALEFEDGKVFLEKGDFIIVPRGVLHRPVCTEPVSCLIIEKDGTLNASNTGGTYKG